MDWSLWPYAGIRAYVDGQLCGFSASLKQSLFDFQAKTSKKRPASSGLPASLAVQFQGFASST